MQMVLQVCAFVLGLLMLWWLSLRAERSSLWMTIALVLILWSVAAAADDVARAPLGPYRRRADTVVRAASSGP